MAKRREQGEERHKERDGGDMQEQEEQMKNGRDRNSKRKC